MRLSDFDQCFICKVAASSAPGYTPPVISEFAELTQPTTEPNVEGMQSPASDAEAGIRRVPSMRLSKAVRESPEDCIKAVLLEGLIIVKHGTSQLLLLILLMC
jgi:hypothetical protein